MKLTELYFEQVLIGFLILLIAALPWLPEIAAVAPNLKELGSVAAIGSAAIGIAFFIGIPFDRLADTLTERLDRLQRLKFAYERTREEKYEAGSDPFPEDTWTLKCLNEDKIVQQWNYLRSRIRLTRALAVFVPALTVTAAYGVSRWLADGNPAEGGVSEYLAWGAIIATYFVWVLLIVTAEGLPRTHEKDFREHAENGRWRPRKANPDAADSKAKSDAADSKEGAGSVKGDSPATTVGAANPAIKTVPPDKVTDALLWSSEAWTWTMPALLLAVTGVVAWYADPRLLLVVVLGVVASAASAWSWWRISVTSRTLLKNLYGEESSAAATAKAGPSQIGGAASPR